VASCAPGTLICVATDLSLPSETIRTMTAAQWKSAPRRTSTKANRVPAAGPVTSLPKAIHERQLSMGGLRRCDGQMPRVYSVTHSMAASWML
jgi:hypothetical protein